MTPSSTPTEPGRSVEPDPGGESGTRTGAERAAGSWASTPGVARSMRSNRRRDTRPELAIRRLLHARGLRYRVDMAPWSNKRRRADIVFARQRLAVFIDGCFWHGCPEHATTPATNTDYWQPKLARNIERDRETDAMAQAEGWKVLRIWEHVPPEEAVRLILEARDEQA